MLAKRIAIDLGTANSIVYVLGKGIVLEEPTVVAVTIEDEKIVAIGNEAKEMLGKTPENIEAMRPLRSGVIADYLVTEALLSYFVNKALGKIRFFKPNIMISIPAGATSVEARAVLEAAYSAGAKTAYLIPEPLAAAIGAELPVSEPTGNMIVNIGGGTSEIAIVSMYGMVVHGSIRVGGITLDDLIIQHVRRKYGLVIGSTTAETIKIKIGSALPLIKELQMEVKGRDSITGFPKTILLNSTEVSSCLEPAIKSIASGIKAVLEKTPPELSSDIIDKGIVLSGGTAMLRSMDKFISNYTGVPVHIADDPMYCVVKGLGKALENLELFSRSAIKR